MRDAMNIRAADAAIAQIRFEAGLIVGMVVTSLTIAAFVLGLAFLPGERG